MNWFVLEPVSADSMVQAGLPFLDLFCAFVGAIAVLLLLAVLIHTIVEVRCSNARFEVHQVGEAKPTAYRLPSPAASRRQLQVSHLLGWLLTR